MTFRPGTVDPELDVRGVPTNDDTRTLADENSLLGAALAGQTGSAASIIAGAGSGQMRVDGISGMTAASIANFLTISGAASGANNGTFQISNYVDADTVDVINASAVVPDGNNGSISWVEREGYTISDNIQFEQTDRKNIKGTTNFYDAIPTYERPSAVGTNVDANLTNLAGVTLDAKAEVISSRSSGVVFRPSINDDDGTVATSDETLTTTGFHFIAGDLNSMITLTDGTAVGATGTYRIKTVTDGQTLELDGLDVTTGGTVTWSLVAGYKGVVSTRGYADAVDRTGLPIADSGAEDETVYAATFGEIIGTGLIGSPSEEDGDPIWTRAFGDEKDANRTATNEGSRFFAQLKVGDNDGTATDSTLEAISGKSGSAASVTNGAETISGLEGAQQSTGTGDDLAVSGTLVTLTDAGATFTSADEGRLLTISGAAAGADDGVFVIEKFVDANNIQYRNASAVGETGGSFTWVIDLRIVTDADIGRWITIWNNATDGHQDHYQITALSGATVTVNRGSNFGADTNNGSINWQISRHSKTWDFYFGDRYRKDQLSETAHRTTLIGGVVSDAELVQDIGEIREAVGISDGESDLSSRLTNTGDYYMFSDLGTSTPSVVEALNVLNGQVGSRDYSGSILTDGQSVTASLQALADAVSGSSVTRVIERLTSNVAAGTVHSLPGSNSYTQDATYNGLNMDVFWRKQLRDPGPASTASNDYEETTGLPTTPGQITPYTLIRSSDSINYMIRN